MAVREARVEVDPNFSIRLFSLISALHEGSLPLPGKARFFIFTQVGFQNEVVRSGSSLVPMW